MVRYATRRIGASIVMLLLTSLLVFAALRVIPGEPTNQLLTTVGVTEAQLERQRAELGLDEPILVQYVDWIGGALTGDLGRSYYSGYAATELIGARMWPTIVLCLAGIIIALLLAVPLAIVSAMRPDSVLDRGIALLTAAGIAVPPFWLALVFVYVFAIELGWLPGRGYENVLTDPVEGLRHLVLPAVALGLVVAAPILRFLRASLREESTAGYTRTAEGKGLIWRRVVSRHALPNAMLPTLTFVGLVVGQMLGGIVVIEFIFGWPGLGSLAVDAVSKHDYILLQSIVLLAAVLFVATNLVVDLLARVLDPRLRTGSG